MGIISPVQQILSIRYVRLTVTIFSNVSSSLLSLYFVSLRINDSCVEDHGKFKLTSLCQNVWQNDYQLTVFFLTFTFNQGLGSFTVSKYMYEIYCLIFLSF